MHPPTGQNPPIKWHLEICDHYHKKTDKTKPNTHINHFYGRSKINHVIRKDKAKSVGQSVSAFNKKSDSRDLGKEKGTLKENSETNAKSIFLGGAHSGLTDNARSVLPPISFHG